MLFIIIKNRLVPKMVNKVVEYQCEFKKERKVVDLLFKMREIQSESFDYKMETYVLFINFKQAYDRLSRGLLYKKL